uniref:Uncharacterized LOC103477974 n=1 Tax=Poecilia reticulata TaxID=8081 RepID=A0A3P9PA04_POERE
MKTIILFGLVLGALSAAGNVYIAEVGGKVTLQCGVTRFSSRLEWQHDSLRSSEIKQRAKKSKETDMEISNIKETDSGKFTCVADRSPHDHHLIVVSVSAPSGPLEVGADATLECKANSGVSGQSQAVVKWRKPDGSVQTVSKVELKSVALTDEGTWQCLVSYQGKEFTKTVTINVEVSPVLIRSDVFAQPGGVRGPEDPMMLLGLVWWIWVAIGAGGLVVIILIIVIIVMHKRNKRKKVHEESQGHVLLPFIGGQTAAAKPQQGRRREKPSALPLQPLLQE